jgi:hypothetical protein
MKKVSDEQLLSALMEHGTIKGAAAATGAAVRTIYDRMHEREFKVMYEAARADVLRGATASLNSRIEKAVSCIEAIMDNDEAPAAVKLNAANAILSNAERFAGRLTEAESHLRPVKEPSLDELLTMELGG